MACTLTINGRAFPCKDKIGGIKRVWIKQFDATDWGTITAGVVAAGTAITVFGFELTKNSGSFQQAVTASMENGVVFYSQVLEMTMPNLIAATRIPAKNFMKSFSNGLIKNSANPTNIKGIRFTSSSVGNGRLAVKIMSALPCPCSTTPWIQTKK